MRISRRLIKLLDAIYERDITGEILLPSEGSVCTLRIKPEYIEIVDCGETSEIEAKLEQILNWFDPKVGGHEYLEEEDEGNCELL